MEGSNLVGIIKDVIIPIGSLSGLLSLGWNGYLYLKSKEDKKWIAERELKKLELEESGIKTRIRKKKEELLMHQVRTPLFYIDSNQERLNDEMESLQEEGDQYLPKIQADKEYYEKLLGKKKV